VVGPIVEALDRQAPASPATARARAFVAEGEDAIALLELAAAAPDPFVAARGHLLLGERLRRAGLRRRAREHLSEAARVFDGLGARPWAARCRTELAATGQPDTRPAPTLGQLTAAELRIATLVGRGRPTRDVAATLFLSPKTVEFHLSSIYRKLGVANRTALAAWMAGQPT